jgi:DNA-binding transcriptional LysR family regulator
MEFHTLEIFIDVAETGSFSKTALRHNCAQSNVSGRMLQLEKECGSRLFYRHNRGVKLTGKGLTLLEYAKKIRYLENDARKMLLDKGEAYGSLRIGAIEAISTNILPQFLTDYHRHHPNVRLSVTTALNNALLEPVLSYDLDGSFLSGPITNPDVETIAFSEEQMFIVASPDAKSLDDLISHAPLITFPEGSSFRARFLNLIKRKDADFQENMVIENSLGAIISSVCAGLGYSYLPRLSVEGLLDQHLLVSFTLRKNDLLPIDFVCRKDHVMDTAFRCFLDEVKNRAAVPA